MKQIWLETKQILQHFSDIIDEICAKYCKIVLNTSEGKDIFKFYNYKGLQ